MAKRLNGSSAKQEPTEATKFANSAIRKEMIQKASIQLDHLYAEIESHQVHIKAARADISEIFAGLKADLQLDRKMFEFTKKHLVDPEEIVRDAAQDCMHEVLDSLRPGQQLDWLKPGAPLMQPHQPASSAPTQPVALHASVSTSRPEFPA